MTYIDHESPVNGSVPMQSIRCDDATLDSDMALLVFLEEIERQSEVFSFCLDDAVAAALSGRTTHTFRHLQGALFSAGVVSRLTMRTSKKNADSSDRLERTRAVLAMNDETVPAHSQLHKVQAIRDRFMHVDEKMDQAIRTPEVSSISDWYVARGFYLGASKSVWAALRAFDPFTGVLFFAEDAIDLYSLDHDMIRLRHNAREAQAEALERTAGSMRRYGGGIVMKGMPELSDAFERMNWWRIERGKLLEALAPPVELNGRNRLYAGPPERPIDGANEQRQA